MCLSSRLTRKAQREAVAKLPEWITVWKVFKIGDGMFYGEWRNGEYTEGQYAAVQRDISTGHPKQPYKSGFHSFATRKGVLVWFDGRHDERIVPCKIKRSWITSIGRQLGHKVYVTNKIKIPPPKQYFKTHK